MLTVHNNLLKINFQSLSLAIRSSHSHSHFGNNGPYIHGNPLVQPMGTTRRFKRKHIDPKYKKERGMKVQHVELPDYNEKVPDDMSFEYVRSKLKERGIQPVCPWNERPIFISCSAGPFEDYVPPEGDGKASIASTQGAKQRLEFMSKKGRSMLAVRKVREFEEDFHLKDFAVKAQGLYVDLHAALAEMDEAKLHRLATEHAFPLVVSEAKRKTIKWAFHGAIEEPRVVLCRQTYLIEKDNIFAQITVRLHTQQTLAVYDRFGRLLHGSENVVRDVLEYVVFEKQISNEYGLWRVHHKIVPSWAQAPPTSRYTFKMPEAQEELPTTDKNEIIVTETRDPPSQELVPAT